MRVLYLTHRLPYAPNRGDRIRSYHTIGTLVRRGFDVDVVSLVHDRDELARVDQVRALGVRVEAVPVPRLKNVAAAAVALASPRPLTHVLLDSPGMRTTLARVVAKRPPDVVLAYCSGMARFALEPPLASYPLVVDLVDIDSQKWRDLSLSSSWPKRWVYAREGARLALFERHLAKVASALVVVNERERETLRLIEPHAAVTVASNGIDMAEVQPQAAPGNGPALVFCGVMNYEPNVEAVLWFYDHVWPAVRAERPDATFSIVGSDPVASIRRLHSPQHGIVVTGRVDDVRPFLWNAAVAVAPLRTARGVQNKVLEAIGAGLPTVVSPAVWEGLPKSVRTACRCADGGNEFARDVLTFLAMAPLARRQIAGTADLGSIGWDVQLRPLEDALRRAARPPGAIAV